MAGYCTWEVEFVREIYYHMSLVNERESTVEWRAG
jgi:hypothetical protein